MLFALGIAIVTAQGILQAAAELKAKLLTLTADDGPRQLAWQAPATGTATAPAPPRTQVKGWRQSGADKSATRRAAMIALSREADDLASELISAKLDMAILQRILDDMPAAGGKKRQMPDQTAAVAQRPPRTEAAAQVAKQSTASPAPENARRLQFTDGKPRFAEQQLSTPFGSANASRMAKPISRRARRTPPLPTRRRAARTAPAGVAIDVASLQPRSRTAPAEHVPNPLPPPLGLPEPEPELRPVERGPNDDMLKAVEPWQRFLPQRPKVQGLETSARRPDRFRKRDPWEGFLPGRQRSAQAVSQSAEATKEQAKPVILIPPRRAAEPWRRFLPARSAPSPEAAPVEPPKVEAPSIRVTRQLTQLHEPWEHFLPGAKPVASSQKSKRVAALELPPETMRPPSPAPQRKGPATPLSPRDLSLKAQQGNAAQRQSADNTVAGLTRSAALKTFSDRTARRKPALNLLPGFGGARTRLQRRSSEPLRALLPSRAMPAPQIELPVEPVLSRRELVLRMQTILAKMGCRPGPLDGLWGRKGQAALERAYRMREITLDHSVANPAALAALSKPSDIACESCGRAETLSRDGTCVAKPKPKAKPRPRPQPVAVAKPKPRPVERKQTYRPKPRPRRQESDWRSDLFRGN